MLLLEEVAVATAVGVSTILEEVVVYRMKVEVALLATARWTLLE